MNCPTCGKESRYCERHDAAYCPSCNIWLESKCDDVLCRFCADRPEKPSEAIDHSFRRLVLVKDPSQALPAQKAQKPKPPIQDFKPSTLIWMMRICLGVIALASITLVLTLITQVAGAR